MTGAGGVVALVLLEWAAGLAGVAAWTQTWRVVRRGHFRIVAWTVLVLAVLAWLANRSAVQGSDIDPDMQRVLVTLVAVFAAGYVLAQYAPQDIVGTIGGFFVAAAGIGAMLLSGSLIPGWDQVMATTSMATGALLLGGVTNGMLLGHWYLNQPGLKPWALARLTALGLVAAGSCVLLAGVNFRLLSSASTEGAVLGLPGFGDSFGAFFFVISLVLIAFTGGIVWMARRCVKIRSIQSATGLYYVAILTAGVAEFLIRYLMLNA